MGPSRTGARSLATALGLALVLLFAGCDSQSEANADAPATTTKTAHKTEPKGGDPDMVQAFSGNRAQTGPGLVDLKFKVTKRPAVGEPVEIELELVPTVELEQLFGRFQAAEGLQIVAGAETEHFEHPAKDVPVTHKLTVTAKTDGIFYITAILLADSDKESLARNFSFPLIAGQGLSEAPAPEAAAANVAAPKRTSGQP